MHRRKFIRDASLATAGLTILNFPVFGKNAPSNKVVLAVMGLNSRGSYLANSYSQLPNVEIAYICDVEDGAIKKGYDALKNAPRKPELVHDIRKLVEKKIFDALVVAAPGSLAYTCRYIRIITRQTCLCRKAMRTKPARR